MSPKSELWAFIVEIVTHLLDHQLELELLLHPGDALHSVPDLLHGRGIVTNLIKVRMRVTEKCTNKSKSAGILIRVFISVQMY